MKFSTRLLHSTMALAMLASVVPAHAGAMEDLVAAAQKEGELTVIALPHDWCGYGKVIDGFKAKYGLKVNELNPDAGSADELEAIRANKDNKGPQAPDVIDVGLAFGPQAQKEGLLQPYKVVTWDEIPADVKDADGHWYADYYGVMAFGVNKDIVKTTPADWADLLKPEYANFGRPHGRSARLEPGDPRHHVGGHVARRRARHRVGREGPRAHGRAQQGRQLRAGHRQVRHHRPGPDADRRRLGLQPPRLARQPEGQPADGRGDPGLLVARRRLCAGDLGLRAASERRQAVDGIPLFG